MPKTPIHTLSMYMNLSKTEWFGVIRSHTMPLEHADFEKGAKIIIFELFWGFFLREDARVSRPMTENAQIIHFRKAS